MITHPTTPVLVDAFMVEFNTKIVNLLPWLNNPLGKVQAVTQMVEGKRVKTPRMFVAGREYNIEVYPNDKITNFSWFIFGKEDYSGATKRRATIKVPTTFNMFLDLRKVYPLVTQSRDIENVKAAVVAALNTIALGSAMLRVNTVSEQYEDVYAGFALPLEQDKFFMQPYAGLSFELDLWVNTQYNCNA
jgi:hypothetical protein